ncbi:hypothetical protein BDF19DRAFT_416852 [Syncephalis fuscata]|nr:hypothetical protein BDF19DRAFT_416852 [Syncephalis fuscata]
MPSSGDQYSIPVPDPQRLSTASTLGSFNSFYTAAGNMTPERDDDDQSLLQDMSTGDIGAEDAGNDSMIAADLGRSTAAAAADGNESLLANDSNDYSAANATVGTAEPATASSNEANGNGQLGVTHPVADLTSHTLSPALQRLSFVNFNPDEPSAVAPSVDATVGSSMARSASLQSNNSTGTMVHEDALARGNTSILSPLTSPEVAAALSSSEPAISSTTMPGKRPALPGPNAFASDQRPPSAIHLSPSANDGQPLTAPTSAPGGVASIQPSPAPSDQSRDYFYRRGANTNPRPITFAGVDEVAPSPNQYNSNTMGHSERRRARRPARPRRASTSAYADSERERTESELEELDDLIEEGDYLSGSTSDTDDYGDPEERKRAQRRHRRRRLIRKRRARLRRAQSAYVSDGGNNMSSSLMSNESAGFNAARNGEASTSRNPNSQYIVHDDDEDEEDYDMLSDHEMTLKDRQEAINSSHPFGLPLWKPALYKKDRSVQRAAESAVHSMPSAQRYISIDNVLWLLLAGWWMSIVAFSVSVPLMLVRTGRPYARVFRGLGWYLFWPFGRCVERITRDRWSSSVTDEMRSEWAALEQQGTLRSIAVRSIYGDASEDENELEEAETIGHDQLPGYQPPGIAAHNWATSIWRLGIGGAVYYLTFFLVIAPMLYLMSAICWFFVFTLPMAKLNKGLARILLFHHFHFDSEVVQLGHPILPYCYVPTKQADYATTSTPMMVLISFSSIFATHHENVFTKPGTIFAMCLCSVIPLAYFIGMAVSSISAQSSLGMGAVINATFGSIVEVILYCFAILQGKEELVEGSLIGSLLCGLLLLPGLSMLSGGIRRKEQKFNSKSAGVTSTMLILSLIGVFTPTLFHQIYGSFKLTCQGCPVDYLPGQNWRCDQCVYDQTKPEEDAFFQSNTKPLMYICTAMLPLAYLVALWFTLRTHVKLIYHQEPTQQENANALRASFYKRLLQQMPPMLGGSNSQANGPIRAPVSAPAATNRSSTATINGTNINSVNGAQGHTQAHPPSAPVSHGHTLNVAIPLDVMQPAQILIEDEAQKANQAGGAHGDGGGHGGHDAPEWSKLKSSVVLLSCTVLFAAVAELLVDTVDEVMENLTLEEKFLGVTLFALVPNVTEFTNAIAFALYGNIALSMEIGSAYAVQVTLLQIPAVVAFSVWLNWGVVDVAHRGFLLLFPTWDVVVSILSVFLLTYIYIEGKSNYFKGSILTIAYLVFVASFYFEPPGIHQEPGIHP